MYEVLRAGMMAPSSSWWCSKAGIALLLFFTSVGSYSACAADPAPEAAKPNETTIRGVGTTVNPAGDCAFKGDAKRLTIDIPGNDHALMTEQNRMTAPRVLQEVTGDFTTEVKVSGSYSEGGGTVVPGRRPFQGAGLLVWVDASMYIRLERAQVDAGEGQKTVYASFEARVGGKPLPIGASSGAVLHADATHLRLTRKGNEITASLSEDGVNWLSSSPLKIELPATLQVGLVAGHNKTVEFEADFEDFSVKKTADGK